VTVSVKFYTVSPKPTPKSGTSEVEISTFMEIMWMLEHPHVL